MIKIYYLSGITRLRINSQLKFARKTLMFNQYLTLDLTFHCLIFDLGTPAYAYPWGG